MTNNENIQEAQTNQPEKRGIDDGAYWQFLELVNKIDMRYSEGEISKEEHSYFIDLLFESPEEREERIRKWNAGVDPNITQEIMEGETSQ